MDLRRSCADEVVDPQGSGAQVGLRELRRELLEALPRNPSSKPIAASSASSAATATDAPSTAVSRLEEFAGSSLALAVDTDRVRRVEMLMSAML